MCHSVETSIIKTTMMPNSFNIWYTDLIVMTRNEVFGQVTQLSVISFTLATDIFMCNVAYQLSCFRCYFLYKLRGANRFLSSLFKFYISCFLQHVNVTSQSCTFPCTLSPHLPLPCSIEILA